MKQTCRLGKSLEWSSLGFTGYLGSVPSIDFLSYCLYLSPQIYVDSMMLVRLLFR
jgi:hypothetical protein